MTKERYLRYNPALNTVTGSVTATLIMLQLEYWFERVGDKFYKFLEPCNDVFYRTGDSWTEELGFSKAEFRSAFTKIGITYKSKSAYNAALDKFQGKLYLSYYDRLKKLTYYMRNDAYVEQVLNGKKVVPTNEVKSSIGSTEKIDREQTVQTYIEKENCLEQVKNSDLPISKNELGVSVDYFIPYQEIMTCFNDACVSYPKVGQLTQKHKEQIRKIWQNGKDNFKFFKDVFCLAEQSDFLSGRIRGATWQADFEWLLKVNKFEAVLQGKYSKRAKKSRFNTIASHEWDFELLKQQEIAYIQQKLEKLRADKDFSNRLISYQKRMA